MLLPPWAEEIEVTQEEGTDMNPRAQTCCFVSLMRKCFTQTNSTNSTFWSGQLLRCSLGTGSDWKKSTRSGKDACTDGYALSYLIHAG